MDPVFVFIAENLFTPGFAAGLVVGFGLCFLSISRGWVSTSRMAELKAEVAGLRAQLDSVEKQLEKLTRESEEFFEWRRQLASDALEERQ